MSSADDNFTTEDLEHDESGKEVLKPNPADIPEGKKCSKFFRRMHHVYIQHDFLVLLVIFSVAIIVYIAQGSYNLDM